MDYSTLTEKELADRLKNGDAGAFREIYLRYWKKLFRIAYSKLPEDDSPEDLIQDIFVKLWENKEQTEITNLSAYLFTSLRHGIINRYRKKIQREKFELQSQYIVTSLHTTEEEIALNDLISSLEQQVEELPDKTRRIFRLNRFEYKTAGEISLLLDLPERTVQHHITLALRKLRYVLKDYLMFVLLILS